MIIRNSVWVPAVLLAATCAVAAQAQTVTTYTGPNGKYNIDTWNAAGNWDNGIPAGTIDVMVGDGKYASVNAHLVGTTTPYYDGSLTLGVNSHLEIGHQSTADDLNALGTGTWTLNAGSIITMRYATNTTHDNDIVMAGDATFELGRSTSAHWEQRTLTGQITGAGLLTIHSTNGNWLHLTNPTNDWSGGLWAGGVNSENKKETISAEATSSLGTGNVTIDDGVTLRLAAINAMSTGATLSLSGGPRVDQSYKLILEGDQTVATAIINGVQLPPGMYDSSSPVSDSLGNPLITGAGVLTVTTGPLLKLRVDPITGETVIVGHGTQGIDINYYQITSDGDSLDAANWTSLADQDFDGNGPADGSGNGWEEAGGSGSHTLAEAFLLGNSTIGAAQTIDLGQGFDPSVGVEDLVFTYRTNSGMIIEGTVEYATSAQPGDANLDGVVDAADYIALKQSFGMAAGARFQNGDFDLDGDVDANDLAILQQNLGLALAGAAVTPEPAMLSLLGVGGLAVLRRRRP